MIKILLNDYVGYHNSTYRITQLIDFDEVIGVNVDTNEVKRLLIKDLKPIKADDIKDNSFISRDLSEIRDSDWQEIERRFSAIKPGQQELKLKDKLKQWMFIIQHYIDG